MVGCGHIGKRHAEMISRNEECELVAMVDVKGTPAVGISTSSRCLFNSLEKSPASGIDTDVNNIATPNGFQRASQALQMS